MWLSTAYGRDTAYIAIHVFHTTPHEEYFREVEAVMTAPGRASALGQDAHPRRGVPARQRIPGSADFVALRDELDPARRFGNPYLEQVLGSVDQP